MALALVSSTTWQRSLHGAVVTRATGRSGLLDWSCFLGRPGLKNGTVGRTWAIDQAQSPGRHSSAAQRALLGPAPSGCAGLGSPFAHLQLY
jgi:hypothetical protein